MSCAMILHSTRPEIEGNKDEPGGKQRDVWRFC